MYYEYDGINAFLAGMSKTLLAEGVRRETRGQVCYELPQPVMIKIRKPTARIVTLPERNWNYSLPYVESLWLALGHNDLAMVTHYVKKLADFSDDGEFMRAGYGPRFRFYNGQANDYQVDGVRNHRGTDRTVEVDQFAFVTKVFERDSFTRQAVITIGDPAKDTFETPGKLKETRDRPCTKSLHFQRIGDRLDLIVHMRSNDFIWGASAVNVFNYTFIQEYFAQLLQLNVGAYYHIADNFHYYEHHTERVRRLAAVTATTDEGYVYPKTFNTLAEFDKLVGELKQYEEQLRLGNTKKLQLFNDPFFDDWAKVLYARTMGMGHLLTFSHPGLNTLRHQELSKERTAKLRNMGDTNNTVTNSQKVKK